MMTLRRNLLSSRLPHLARQEPSGDLSGVAFALDDDAPALPQDGISPLPTSPPDVGDLPTLTGTASSSVKTINGTPAPAQAPAKTEKNKCTPSPTKALAPSATWTACPYEIHDGKVNPDVRVLPDSPAVVTMSQAVLYNALACAMTKTRSYSQNAAKFIDTFFLAPSTAMNPNLNFGQLVRGPGKVHQMGTFTGILDLRVIVKIINAIALLKAAGSPDWTSAREQAMTNWMRSYASWLESSAIGKETASKANNHVTFYVNQLAAAKMYIGDTQGARTALQNYFTHQFRDQVAASGEQPFEAIRTRPFHYRCFNLEAMITNAKLGDQLGVDFWTTKSKYGATIQTALDYVMAIGPKNEDITDIFPHVAAVAAAYGDPQGKYSAFLRSKAKDYASQPFWLYDQSSALSHSPAGQSKRRRDLGIAFDRMEHSNEAFAGDMYTVETVAMDGVRTVESGDGPFECPEVFDTAKEVDLEDGLSVTCGELEPYYEIELPVNQP
ncbi:chondroitin AC/alginate lyase [Ganoderma leucocontextum]|nr:chondroitin AC/alginate lyase [Ganoderma leucocontextum]